jgi:serine/threonine protein kinase
LLAEQMAWGLSTLHTAGIVHTDVRPENFMIVGKTEAVKVLGFERATIGGVGAMDCLGRSGAISGAAEYLAPEQIERKEITRQTDIYALGVVLYQMLTGVAPFRAATREAVMAMHLRKAPIPLRTLRPEIPAVLEGKVLQALQKEPQERMGYAYDVVNKSLYELVMDELQAQPVQGGGLILRMREGLQEAVGDRQSRNRKGRQAGAGTKRAVTSGVQKVLQADFDARSTAPESAHAAASWKLTASIGLLILVAVLAWWMAFVRKVPEVPSSSSTRQNPPAQQDPGAAQEPGPAVASGPEGTAGERAPLETPQEATSQETTNPIEKKSMAEGKQEQSRPPRNARILPFPRSDAPVHAAPRSEAPPVTKAESPSATPDPTEVIDWLLKHR